MRTHFATTFLFLLIACNVQAVVINEIVPNPTDYRDRSEWIEIVSQGNTSLENITVDTGETNPIILNGSIKAGEFLIITKNKTAFLEIWNSNVTVFEGRGMSLHNEGDNITIYNSTGIISNISYPDFSKKEGYSWARMDNGSWVYCDSPTPGEPNSFTNASVNETEENQTNNTCDLYLWIKCDEIFVADISNEYYPMVEDKEGGDFEPEVEYWIEDMFGNIARSKFRTNNTNVAKSWTPPEITGTEAYLIRAVITNEVCNDTNLSNNVAEKLIVVKGDRPYSEIECSCETETIEIQKPCLCGYASEEAPGKEEHFKIVSCPGEIGRDGEIEIKVNMKNPSPDRKNYTVYSYVYEGNRPVSLGLEGEDWINTWNANRQNLSIEENSSLNLTLKNRIAEDTEAGKYKVRVRIWEEGEKHDITRDILIKEPARAEIPAIEDENKTELNGSESGEQASEIRIPTGRISSEEVNWFSAFIESLINFFKNLFNL